jgi:hypothetical protein
MAETATESEWQSRKVKNWLLTILRFAVTRDEADLVCVLEIAREIDRLGSGTGEASFSFFVRTSADICNTIVDDQDSKRQTTLRRYFNRIDDYRLRAALEAATECHSAIRPTPKATKRNREDLWRGLRSR